MTAKIARRTLRKYASPRRAEVNAWFFKTGKGEYGEGDRFIGVTVPHIRKVAKEFLLLSLPEVQNLLKSSVHEERLLALVILVLQYQRADGDRREKFFRFYLRNRKWVNNWDLVDTSASQIVGCHLYGRPAKVIRDLARSKSLWDRRIAMVSTYYWIKNGQLHLTFKLARLLIDDQEDLMHKATGWMLREAGKKDAGQLRRFLNQHAKLMPRTMLRYSIERFPPAERKRIMLTSSSRQENRKK